VRRPIDQLGPELASGTTGTAPLPSRGTDEVV
jgi:hypothetical protein